MNYIDIIHQFIDPIVANKELVNIEEKESNGKSKLFVISSTNEDMGRLIGKHGSTANALREVISIAAKSNNERVHIKIVSIEEQKDEENPQ